MTKDMECTGVCSTEMDTEREEFELLGYGEGRTLSKMHELNCWVVLGGGLHSWSEVGYLCGDSMLATIF